MKWHSPRQSPELLRTEMRENILLNRSNIKSILLSRILQPWIRKVDLECCLYVCMCALLEPERLGGYDSVFRSMSVSGEYEDSTSQNRSLHRALQTQSWDLFEGRFKDFDSISVCYGHQSSTQICIGSFFVNTTVRALRGASLKCQFCRKLLRPFWLVLIMHTDNCKLAHPNCGGNQTTGPRPGLNHKLCLSLWRFCLVSSVYSTDSPPTKNIPVSIGVTRCSLSLQVCCLCYILSIL